jgi:hypothetical protein
MYSNTRLCGELVLFNTTCYICSGSKQRIYNSIQLPDLRKNVQGIASVNNKYLACPNDFLAVYSMAVIDNLGVYAYLLNKDVNFIREAYPNPSSTGIPINTMPYLALDQITLKNLRLF